MATLQDYIRNQQVNLNSPLVQPQKPKQSKLKSLLQFLAPVGGSLAGGAIGGPLGLVGGGAAGAGLLNMLGWGREDEDPFTAAKKDALYSVLGLGVGKAVGPLVGAAGKKLFPQLAKGVEEGAEQGSKLLGTAKPGGGTLGRIATESRESIAKPEIAKGGFFEPRRQQVDALMRAEGVQSSARAQSRQIGKETLPRLNAQVEDLIAKNNVRIKPTDVRKAILEEANSANRMHRGEPVFDKNIEISLKEASKIRNLRSVYLQKKAIPSSVHKENLTPAQDALKAKFDALSKVISEKGTPEIGELNFRQWAAGVKALGAQKQAEKTMSVPFGGSVFSGLQGPVRSGRDLIGRNLQGLGEAGQTTLGRMSGPAGAALGAGLGGIQQPPSPEPQQISPEGQTMGQPMEVPLNPQQDAQGNKWLENPATGEILSEDMQWVFNKQTNDWEQNTQLEGQQGGMPDAQSLVKAAYDQALSGNSKGSDQLLQIAAALDKIKGGGLDVNSQKKVTQLNQAESIITEFAKRALQLNPSESAPLARLKGLGATLGSPVGAISPEVRAFRYNRK